MNVQKAMCVWAFVCERVCTRVRKSVPEVETERVRERNREREREIEKERERGREGEGARRSVREG